VFFIMILSCIAWRARHDLTAPRRARQVIAVFLAAQDDRRSRRAPMALLAIAALLAGAARAVQGLVAAEYVYR